MLYQIIFGSYTLQEKFILAVSFLAAIYFAIVLHEIAHGVVAKWNGDATAQMMGRFSLNPLRHFEPMGLAMYILVGIGWAKPVPVNPNNFRNTKKGMITVALAGVAMNLILGLISFGVYLGVGYWGMNVVAPSDFLWIVISFLYYTSFFSTYINVSLIAFNLLPLYPLDGFRLIESFAKPNNKFIIYGRKFSIYVFFVLIGLGLVADFTGWNCDVLGMYIGLIQSWVTKLYNLILFGG